VVDQLGLKLESRKEPFAILVIDHVEKAPDDYFSAVTNIPRAERSAFT
jgi:hypothetical protein